MDLERTPQTKEEAVEIVNSIIKDKYNFFRIKAKELFKSRGLSHTVGRDVDDIVQEAALRFIESLSDMLDDRDVAEFVENKMNEDYVYMAVVNNIKRVFYDIERHDGARNRWQQDVKAKFFASNPFDDYEKVEVDEFKREVSPVKRTLIRMLEEGRQVQEIMDRLDIPSVDSYYNIIEALQRKAIEKGYVKHE